MSESSPPGEAASPPVEPAEQYRQRLAARATEVERLHARDRLLSWVRLVLFALSFAIAWASFGGHLLPSWLLWPPAVGFFVAVFAHDRALTRRRLMERAAAFYQRGLDRVQERWRGAGVDGARFDDEKHPYARDLDLFGRGSVFERLCTARTHAGEETLATWLKGPAPLDEVRARQAAVAELRDRLDLREQLALSGDDVRAEVNPGELARWAAAPTPPVLTRTRLVLPPLMLIAALATVTLLLGWLVAAWPWWPVLGAIAVEYLLSRQLAEAVKAVSAGVDRPEANLQVLASVLARLEREPVQAPKLLALKQQLTVDGAPASREIAQLARLAHLLGAQRNQFFAPFGWLLMWPQQLVYRVEAWRHRAGPAIPRWLAALGELEALTSLAGYAFERPCDAVPQLLDEGPLLDGEALGHPLLADDECVRNDVTLGGELRLLLISGSNMSGKSTLLRTVGVNVVLALAGAPVRATRLRLSALQLGATLRVQDSLEAGASRFYAEIVRIRQLVELASGTPPLLFLLDEILAGTNSHDRRLGAEAVVRGLLERGAIGLCTTHDLALADMAEALGRRARNVHFEDTLDGGELHFDYKMRDGVVRKSNALQLMRAVGLEV